MTMHQRNLQRERRRQRRAAAARQKDRVRHSLMLIPEPPAK